MEFISSIGERLREERERLDLSQSEMALLAKDLGAKGATRQSQALYEKGEQSPSAAYIAAISTSGADVLYILTGKRSCQSTESAAAYQPPLSASMNQPTASVAAYALSRRQRALLDNYEHSDEAGKKIIEGTANMAAQSATALKKT